jgi:hypothetical protein
MGITGLCCKRVMTYVAVSKELLAAKYAKGAPQCQTAWPLFWPQNALRQQLSLCLLCKNECAPEDSLLTQALLSRF